MAGPKLFMTGFARDVFPHAVVSEPALDMRLVAADTVFIFLAIPDFF